MNPFGNMFGTGIGLLSGQMSANAARQQADYSAYMNQAMNQARFGQSYTQASGIGPIEMRVSEDGGRTWTTPPVTLSARQCDGCGVHTTARICEYCGRPH